MSKVIGLDFETETDSNNNCKPLLCCLNGEKYKEAFELDVKERYEAFYWTLVLSGHTYVVFNASFDIEIIMIMLMKNGFKFLTNEQTPDHKTMKLTMGQKIYELRTYFRYKGKLIETRYIDLANILVGNTLAEVAEMFTDLHKGDFEASKNNREKFIEYCMLDAEITRVAYMNVCNILGKQYLTIGSAAFNIMLNMSFKGKTKREKFGKFRAIFGNNDLEFDDKIRKWYAGGFGWASTDDRTEVNINSYDLKSAYPSVSVDKLPTSKDKMTIRGYAKPNEKYPYAFIHMKVTGQVRENYAPVLPSRNIYGDSNIYLYDDKDVYIIQEYGKKSEYEWFLENVEIDDMEYIETILMKDASYNPLRNYMMYYYAKKEHDVGIMREMDKRLLNALTGKLGTNPRKENIQFRLDENNKIVKNSAEEVLTEVYATHIVAVITSRVRCKCYEVDSMIRDKVSFRMYATDSVKHSSNISVIKTGKTLGEWDLEYKDIEFIFLGLKAYIFDANNKQGKRKVMCAGISKKYKPLIKNEDFFASTVVKSLISVRSGNGRIIYEGEKRIATPVKKPRTRRALYEQIRKQKNTKIRYKRNTEAK